MLVGRYELEQTKDVGEQGQVRHGRDRLLDVPVVVRSIRAGDQAALLRAARLRRCLHHPNLAQIHDLVREDDALFVVAERIDGPDLIQWTEQGADAPRLALAAGGLLRALQYLHAQGMVLRCLSPEQIGVAAGVRGELPAVVVTDLGLLAAGLLDAQDERQTAGLSGYLAPEVLAGGHAGAAADLYSLGATLYRLICGAPPPLALSAAERRAALHGGCHHPVMSGLISDMLAPSPEARPGVDQLLEGFSAVAGRRLALSLDELRGDYLPRPPLVGRDEPLRRLERLADEVVSQGATHLVRVQGAGTSRMLQELASVARAAGLSVLNLSEPRDLVQLIDGSSTEAPVQLAATRAVEQLVRRAAHQPLVLCLDRLPAADPLAARLLRELELLADRPAPPPLLVAHAVGEGGHVQGPEALATPDRWIPLVLGHLSEAETVRLVRSTLYAVDHIPWLQEVHQATGGDPRLLVELVRAQLEAGLPPRLLDVDPGELVSARLAALPSRQRELLAAVALSPVPVPPSLLGAMSFELSDLGPLLARGLLVMANVGLRPASRAVGQAAIRKLGGDEQVAIHCRYLQALSAGGLSRPEVTAHHLLHSGSPTEAAPLLTTAERPDPRDLTRLLQQLPHDDKHWPLVATRLARMALAAGQQEEAFDLARRCTAHWPVQGALLRAELLLDQGQPALALESLAPLADESPMLWLTRARARAALGDYTAAADDARRGLASSALQPGPRLLLHNVLGICCIYLGQPVAAVELLERAVQSCGELERAETNAPPLPHEATISARLLNTLAMAYQRLDRLDEAIATYDRSIDAFQQAGDLQLAAGSAMNRGTALHRRGNFEQALACYRRAGRLATRAGHQGARAWATANEANLLQLFGASQPAEAKLHQALALAQECGDRSLMGHVLLFQAEARGAAQSAREAQELVRRAGALFSDSDQVGLEQVRLVGLELALAAGDTDGAWSLCQQLDREMAGDAPERGRLALLHGRLALAADPPQLELARAQLQRALERGGSGIERTWQVHAQLARCHHAQERFEAADQAQREMVAALERLRRRVPAQFRAAFDARGDIRAERQQVATLGAMGQASLPSASVARLLQINVELNQGLPLQHLLERILLGAIELVQAERAVLLVRGEGDALTVRMGRDRGGQPLRGARAQVNRTIAAQALCDDRPVALADATAARGEAKDASDKGSDLRAVLCVPLRPGGEPRGVLYLDTPFRGDWFDEQRVALARAFAVQAAIAWHNAQLVQELAGQREQLAAARADLRALNAKLQLELDDQAERLTELKTQLRRSEQELVRRYNAAQIVGSSGPMRQLFVQIDRVAQADVPLVIEGESGTGKELIARAIHRNSPRRQQPFVAVNCGAIPASLLESELFGHVKGAFTGAVQTRQGVFGAAGDGSLLLDEVGDMPQEMQVKLLRVLQDGTYFRLGDSTEQHTRCRVLAASHKPLDALVAAGEFREDLYYRLSVVTLRVPPLRERREDIPHLVAHILDRAGSQQRVSPAAMAALLDHHWSGNVRELDNEIRRACLLSDQTIEVDTLSAKLRPTHAPQPAQGLRQALAGYERGLIQAALEQHEFNVSRTAEALGIHRVVLHRRMRALGISRSLEKLAAGRRQ